MLRYGSCDDDSEGSSSHGTGSHGTGSYGDADYNQGGYESEAESLPCLKPCQRDFLPVCGTDQHTYSNLCSLENAACRHPHRNIQLASNGMCNSESQSIFDSYNHARAEESANPSPGEPGHMSGGRDQRRRPDPSSQRPGGKCFRHCTREYRPVCSSNNVSYGNKCIFDVANCRSNMQLSVMHPGRCAPRRDPGEQDI